MKVCSGYRPQPVVRRTAAEHVSQGASLDAMRRRPLYMGLLHMEPPAVVSL